MSNRIGWDELFMKITRLYSQRSTCEYFKVGVIFVRDNRILTAGYNGPPSGESHCSEVGCAKRDKNGNRLPAGSGLCRGAHAEMNAIANASKEGVNLKNSVVYCTYSPCYDCSKVLINLDVRGYVYDKDYVDESRKTIISLLERQGVIVRKLILIESEERI